MSHSTPRHANHPFGDPYAGVPSLGRRVRDALLVWLLFTVPVGVAAMPPDAGLIGALSGVIAGCIILLPMGAVMALIGATWRGTLVGGAVGGAVGLAVTLAGLVAPPQAAAVLITGAMIGGTLPAMVRHLVALGQRLAGLTPRAGR